MNIMTAIISIVLIEIVLAAIGAWIGSIKNRTGLGSLFGLLLGPIGWIIIAVLPEAKQSSISRVTSRHASRGIPCPMCSKLVPQGNSTCPSCSTSLFA